MSANLEKSDSLPRVTRSMRRMNSSDSLNQDTERPETPTGRLRATKKLESIDETAITPTRRATRAGSVQKTISVESTTPASPLRRVTRRMSNDNAEFVPSPLLKRPPIRKTAVTESDDDDVIFINEGPMTSQTKVRMKRVSINVVKLEEVVEEEQPEIEVNNDKLKNDKSSELNKSTDLNISGELNKSAELHDLQLRNRSISKSPLVISRSSISSNDNNSSIQEISNDSITNDDNSIKTNVSVAKSINLTKSPKQKSSEFNVSNQIAPNYKETGQEKEKYISPSKSPKKKSSELFVSSQIAPTNKETGQKKEKSISPSKSPRKKSSSQNLANGNDLEVLTQLDSSLITRQTSKASLADTISDELMLTISKTFSDETQNSGFSPECELTQRNLTNYRHNVSKQFDSDNDNEITASDSDGSNLIIQASKSPEKSNQGSLSSAGLTSQQIKHNDSISEPIDVPIRVYDHVEKEKLLFKRKDYTQSQNTENATTEVIPTEIEPAKSTESIKELSIISKDSGFSNKADESAKEEATPKENEEIVSEMMEDFVATQKPDENVLKKTPSLFNKTQMTTVDMDIGSDEEVESSLDETNKQDVDMEITTVVGSKQSPVKSNTWNQSVTGSSSQIDCLKKQETEVIHETSIKKKKFISSDESEGESETENNSLIDNEAEVASDEEESMTKSERDYLEENEYIEDGESLGSKDSDEDEINTDDSQEENDSFIDEDEDIDDRYSMDSNDKALEEEELSKSRSKRKSRILIPSSSESEAEAPISSQKLSVPEQSECPDKLLPKINERRVAMETRKSMPNMSEKTNEFQTRKSMPNFNESKSKSFTKSPKMSRKSNIQEEAEKALSDAEKEISGAEKTLSDAENATNSCKKKRKSINLAEAEKALSDAENAERDLLSPNKSAKKNHKSNISNEIENASELHKAPKLDNKGRKSLPNLEKTEKIPKSGKKTRKTLSSLNVELFQVENVQSPLKALENSAKKSGKSVTCQESSKSDILSVQIDSLDKSDTTAKESSQDEISVGKKRKREMDDETSASKRVRKMSANESEALHMDNQENLINESHSSVTGSGKKKKKQQIVEINDAMDVDEEVQVKKSKKKQKVVEIDAEPIKKVKKDKKVKEIDFNAILNRCNEYMEKTKEEKKAKIALKKEKKAKKLEKKKLEKEAAASTEEKLDSSTGENKENSEKIKKKKNKKKKQKLVEEFDDGKKEDISDRLDKLQQKLELKRQRKKEKKLAKLAEQAAEPEKSVKTVEKKIEKPQKVAVHEAGPSKLVRKKEKVAKIQHEVVEEGEVTKKKSKKHKLVEDVVEVLPEVKVKKSKKLANSASEVEQSAPVYENKKAKKRQISEIVDENDTDVIEKPKAKKKLNILKEVENSSHGTNFKKLNNNKHVEHAVKPTSTLTSKLNKVIPKGLGNEVKQVAKKKKVKVFEEKKIIKRPVWTSAGMFIEEPVAPYKFKTTEYKTVNFGPDAASKAKVVIFSAQKSSKSAVVDHKMQAIMKKNKNRDKSIKNLKNLM